MGTLTKEQIAVINSPEAMKVITDGAKKFLASKFNCDVSDIELAYAAQNEKVTKMLADIIRKAVDECAKLIK